MNTLKRLSELVIELNTTNSTNEKQTILAKYEDLKDILSLIYSDFEQFGVTSKNVLKMEGQLDDCSEYTPRFIDTLGDLLKSLSNKEFTGHKALSQVHLFLEDNKDYKDLILNALDKNLKCRIDTSLINKVFPGCISTFDVALAKSIDKVTKKPNFNKEIYFSSRKLDGLRCVVVVEDGKANAYSRTGKEFKTLNKVTQEIENFCKFVGVTKAAFDGEICLMDDQGNEDFQGIMKEYNRKDHTIENPKYNIFDLIKLSDFKAKQGSTFLEARLMTLNEMFNTYKCKDPKYISILKQTRVIDQNHFEILKKEALDKGWEGIMLRKNVGYEGKRTNNLLKVKAFLDAEYVVESIETGPFRVINSITGLEEEVQTLTRVNISHKGFKVGVGSGFSLQQRQDFYNDPNKIIGKTITVQYFEESTNEQGGISLRFPTIKAIYEEERNV